jgi:hypothetical protein
MEGIEGLLSTDTMTLSFSIIIGEVSTFHYLHDITGNSLWNGEHITQQQLSFQMILFWDIALCSILEVYHRFKSV